MRVASTLGTAVAFAVAILVHASDAAAQTYTCPALGTVSGNTITQEFQAGGPGGAFKPAWKVTFGYSNNEGLYIADAQFRKKPSDAWMTIIYDVRLSQIFVPYHDDLSLRFYDLGFWTPLVDAMPQDRGLCGDILGGKIVFQLNNSELAWKNDEFVRYREEMVLWATIDAENYNYVIRYGFADDGTISLRLGSTASNLPGSPTESHMHNALWRIDMDLDGAQSDSVFWMVHTEPSGGNPGNAADTMDMNGFNGGIEGSAVWNATAFNHLLVEDQVTTNAAGKRISYEFMPVRMGRAAHYNGGGWLPNEAYTQADFWVTQSTVKNGTNEMEYVSVPSYVSDGASIMNTDVVIWHMSSAHHQPRDEDGFVADGLWNGSALIMWSGLDIRPRNLWDGTPLYAGCLDKPVDTKFWFHYNDGTFTDSIGSITGTAAGTVQAATSVPPNLAGQALALASNGRINFPASASFNFGTGDFSIDAWIKTTSVSGVNSILDTRFPGSLEGIAMFTYQGRIGLQMADGNFTNFVATDSKAMIADGEWHHVTVTVSRTALPREIKFYVDGAPLLSVFDPTVRSGPLGADQWMVVGHDVYLNNPGHAFEIDDLEVFHRVLSEPEIQTLAQYPKCPP